MRKIIIIITSLRSCVGEFLLRRRLKGIIRRGRAERINNLMTKNEH